MDSGDKAANKAMAIGHKYALLQVLCIPTEDMVDPDSESPEGSSPRYVQATVKIGNPTAVRVGNAQAMPSRPKSPQPIDDEPQPDDMPWFEEGVNPGSGEQDKSKPMVFEVIPESEFTPEEAYDQLLAMAKGDKDFVGETLKTFHVYSMKGITYDAYKATIQYLKMKKGVAIAS